MGIGMCCHFTVGGALKGITEVSYGARRFSCSFGRSRIGCSFRYSHNVSFNTLRVYLLTRIRSSCIRLFQFICRILSPLTFRPAVFSQCRRYVSGRTRQTAHVCVCLKV